MRPLKLSLQAFGPFANRLDIDFQTIGGAALYGFYGPTGSGKTSVLDAICFALFGESSGGEREGGQLRSDYASPKEESFVSLIFSVGSKRYFVHRIPDYEKKKLRGEGTTQQKHEAWLFDVTGIALEDIGLDHEVGILLAEKKVNLVRDKVVEILGYRAAQFRQVVMLPQGKFRDFLVANSKARSEILRNLFDMSLFRNLETVLAEKSKILREEIQTVSSLRDGILEASGQESIEAVVTLRLQQESEIESLQKAITEKETTFLAVKKIAEEGRKLEENFTALAKAQKQEQALLDQSTEIKVREEKLVAGRKAMAIRHIAEAFVQAQKEKQAADQELATVVKQKDLAQRSHDSLKKQVEESELQSVQREQMGAQILEKTRFLSILQKQEPLVQSLKELNSQKDSLTSEVASVESRLEQCDKQHKTAQDKVRGLESSAQSLAQKKASVALLDIQLKQFQTAETKRQDIEKIKQKMTVAQLAWQKAEQQFAEKTNFFTTLDQDFRASQAVVLAQNLINGTPCPVCGGKDHPEPAHQHSLVAISEEALEQARTALEKARKLLHKTALDLKQLENELVFVEKDYKTVKQELDPALTGDKLQDVLHKEKAVLTELTQQVSQTEVFIQELAELEKERNSLTLSLEKSKHELSALNEAVIQKDAAVKAAISSIPEGFRDPVALADWLKKETLQHKIALAHHEKLMVDFQKIIQQLVSLQDQEKRGQSAQNNRLSALEKAQSAFIESLEKHGFSDEQMYQKAFMKPADLEADENAIRDYYERLKAAKDHVARCIVLVGEQKSPNIKELEERLTEAEKALQDVRKQHVESGLRLKTLLQTLAQYQEKTKLFEDLDQRYRRAKTLADVASGTGDNQRKIRLVDWLLSSYFDDVLSHANIRFAQMTQKRFYLRRSQSVAKGGRASGLDIEIYDDWLDASRSAVSLSGGESFLAALALALGLSDVVQQESGGVVLETIFIDEGFGHLDDEALDHALNVLTGLSGSNRSVGIISHVEEVKRRVPAGFDIIPSQQGSMIVPRNQP